MLPEGVWFLYLITVSLRYGLTILIWVPFMPRDLDSRSPALLILRIAFTTTELVRPYCDATLLVTIRPSSPSRDLRILSRLELLRNIILRAMKEMEYIEFIA